MKPVTAPNRKKIDRLLQILGDPENQPHQYIGDYDEIELLIGEAFEDLGWSKP